MYFAVIYPSLTIIGKIMANLKAKLLETLYFLHLTQCNREENCLNVFLDSQLP